MSQIHQDCKKKTLILKINGQEEFFLVTPETVLTSTYTIKSSASMALRLLQ
jgi:hypothetical protein